MTFSIATKGTKKRQQTSTNQTKTLGTWWLHLLFRPRWRLLRRDDSSSHSGSDVRRMKDGASSWQLRSLSPIDMEVKYKEGFGKDAGIGCSTSANRRAKLQAWLRQREFRVTKLPHLTKGLIGNYHYGFNIEHAKQVLEKGLIVNSLLGDITTSN